MSRGRGESDRREVPTEVDGLDLPSILAGLDADDPETRREAVTTVRAVVEDSPAACTPTVPKLRALLGRSEIDYRDQIIACLATLAADSPTDVAPSTAEIVSFAASTPSSEARTTAFRCLGAIATRRPSAVAEHVETLVAAVQTELDERGLALLSQLARTHPNAVFPAVPVLATALESEAVEVRIPAARTIARVAAGDGTAVDRARARLRGRLGDDEPAVRRNACLALGHGGAPEARERLETLASADPDVAVRNCASWALAEFEDRDSDAEPEFDLDLDLVSDVDSRSRFRSDPPLPSPFRAEPDRRSELKLERSQEERTPTTVDGERERGCIERERERERKSDHRNFGLHSRQLGCALRRDHRRAVRDRGRDRPDRSGDPRELSERGLYRVRPAHDRRARRSGGRTAVARRPRVVPLGTRLGRGTRPRRVGRKRRLPPPGDAARAVGDGAGRGRRARAGNVAVDLPRGV